MLALNTIKNLTNLKNDLVNLEWASNVITVLDVPLLNNNDDPLAERIKILKLYLVMEQLYLFREMEE